MIIEINKDNFEEKVNNKEKVLVDFYANWCSPCKMIRPTLEQLANDYNIMSIDIDENEELADKYNVSSIPCLVIFKDGKEIDRSIGLKSKEEIEKLLGDN